VSERGAAILDASAFLAYLWSEPGSAAVREALVRGAVMSTVNWAEVLSRLVDVGEDPDVASAQFLDRGVVGGLLDLVDLSSQDALTMARLRLSTRPFGLSLGDRACLALGVRLGLPVLTADHVWTSLSIGVTIHDIRPMADSH
jgi:ribonuclease VapC